MSNQPNQTEILVVDDVAANLTLLVTLLKEAGYTVRATLNPELALKSALATPPALLLLDVRMPGMDGFEVCRRLKMDARTCDIPVIFVSGLNDVADRVRGFAAGGVDYISKPFQREEVLARVRTHLALREIQNELERRVQDRTAELTVAREVAESASRAKSEFLKSISHEFRTPLNAIVGYGEILAMDEALNDDQRGEAVAIVKAGDHLLSLVNDLIDLACFETERLDFAMGPIMPVVAESLGMAESLVRERGITVVKEARDEPALVIRVDFDRLRQIVFNLLANAIKFNRSGGGVTLSCGMVNGKVRISVADTGPGIPDAQQSSIFNAFVRLDTGGNAQGIGVGLVITKRIAEAMGGTVGFESAEGRGSTFWVEFPAAVSAESPGRQV